MSPQQTQVLWEVSQNLGENCWHEPESISIAQRGSCEQETNHTVQPSREAIQIHAVEGRAKDPGLVPSTCNT